MDLSDAGTISVLWSSSSAACGMSANMLVMPGRKAVWAEALSDVHDRLLASGKAMCLLFEAWSDVSTCCQVLTDSGRASGQLLSMPSLSFLARQHSTDIWGSSSSSVPVLESIFQERPVAGIVLEARLVPISRLPCASASSDSRESARSSAGQSVSLSCGTALKHILVVGRT